MNDWILDADLQRRAQIGLNKREAHHAQARHQLPSARRNLRPLRRSSALPDRRHGPARRPSQTRNARENRYRPIFWPMFRRSPMHSSSSIRTPITEHPTSIPNCSRSTAHCSWAPNSRAPMLMR
jgi:hypothetical protein